MVELSQLAIPFVMFLIGINTIFAAMITLPGDQFGDPAHKLFSDISSNPDLNKSMFTYVNSINKDTNSPLGPSDVNAVISVTPLNALFSVLFNLINDLTMGGLGFIIKIIGFIIQMAFGYMIWIDYFFNPAWGSFVSIIGGLIKGTILIIELYGITTIVMGLLGRSV